MTGILLIGVFIVWFIVALMITLTLVYMLPKEWLKPLIGLPLFAALMMAPLADEIFAKPKFEALCNEKAKFVVVQPDLNSKTVWYSGSDSRELVLGTIRVVETRTTFIFPDTQAVAYYYITLQAYGGWLMRLLKISETNSALIFSNFCAPSDLQTFQSDRKITAIDHPKFKQ